MNKTLWITLGALLLLGIGGYYYFGNLNSSTETSGDSTSIYDSNQPVACTTEAKICPDGSSVGRTGPTCEFAQCPDSSTTAS